MLVIRALCLLIAGVAACGSDAEEVTDPASEEPIVVTEEAGLEDFPADLDAIRAELLIPGMAAAIANDGVVVWAQGFGHADVGAAASATDTTPFHLASLTKPFASTILMQLVEQGLVDLDDPLSQYGINIASPGTVRVRHILTHTSHGTPGAGYQYDGGRFAYLDQVIESASGRSFESHLVEQILDPLGLVNTAPNPLQPSAFALTGLDLNSFLGRMASGYLLSGGTVYPQAHPDYFGVSAGLVASARDVAKFSIAVDEGRFLAAETWNLVFTPAVSNAGATLPYGLGWFIYESQGITYQWHYGWWTSNSSLIVRVPENSLTFVALANTPQLSAAYGLGEDSNLFRSDVARLFIDYFVLGDEPFPEGL